MSFPRFAPGSYLLLLICLLVCLFLDYRSKSMSSTSSGAAATPTHRMEKDYFKVTDELSQENAHFAVSEAMLTVLELYRSNTLERTRLRSLLPQVSRSPEVPASCSFPLPIAHVPGISSPNSATPHLSPNLPVPSPLPFTMSSPLRGEKPSPGPELSSWSSMSSIATTEGEWVLVDGWLGEYILEFECL